MLQDIWLTFLIEEPSAFHQTHISAGTAWANPALWHPDTISIGVMRNYLVTKNKNITSQLACACQGLQMAEYHSHLPVVIRLTSLLWLLDAI